MRRLSPTLLGDSPGDRALPLSIDALGRTAPAEGPDPTVPTERSFAVEAPPGERDAIDAATRAELPHPPAGDVSWAMDEALAYPEPVRRAAAARAWADGAVVAAWNAHHEELHVFLVRQVRDDEVAEDLLQETYLRFMQQVRHEALPDNVRAWLYRVAANLAVSRARRAHVAIRGLLRIGGQVARAEPEAGPDVAVLVHESNSEVRSALATLQPDARAALLLAAQGFSGPEIAALIRRTPMATRTLMCRARREVRSRLERTEAAR